LAILEEKGLFQQPRDFATIAETGTSTMSGKTNENVISQESKDLVVFDIVRDSECAECRKELLAHDFLFMEDGRPLCLTCADLDHLAYLPRGDAALTRRARKNSSLSAVVVRFSRARKRYERQGVLVEETALERAAEECHADSSKRLADREKASLRRVEQDRELALRMTESILALYPGCPPAEAQAIAVHTSRRGSGRVGRSAAGRALEVEALKAAVVAAIRHRHTRYDQLLMRGYSRRDARDAVYEAIDHLLERWRAHS
jgi:hypothetical protein